MDSTLSPSQSKKRKSQEQVESISLSQLQLGSRPIATCRSRVMSMDTPFWPTPRASPSNSAQDSRPIGRIRRDQGEEDTGRHVSDATTPINEDGQSHGGLPRHHRTMDRDASSFNRGAVGGAMYIGGAIGGHNNNSTGVDVVAWPGNSTSANDDWSLASHMAIVTNAQDLVHMMEKEYQSLMSAERDEHQTLRAQRLKWSIETITSTLKSDRKVRTMLSDLGHYGYDWDLPSDRPKRTRFYD
ncbi:MAG: hypothetical protein J3Q66DRAFT_340178 [Benniella sp.]|nr:MAG: hypothetical protein J3Q66DRAFT_340178 [Benniella sp.]